MARQTYPVGGQRFGKRSDLPDHIRGIVAKHQDDEPIGEADLAFVADLLGNHPHANVKGGVGVALGWRLSWCAITRSTGPPRLLYSPDGRIRHRL